MDDTGAPMFTVVIPLYDKAAYIDATLASVAGQTFDDYEVIVVDDGSRDDGPARVEAAGGRVRLLRAGNAGPGIARNRGIAEARGAWVAFLDADDLWRPEHLMTLARTIMACPEADVAATGFERAAGAFAAPKPMAAGTARIIDFFSDYGLVWTSAVAIRTSVLRDEPFGACWPGEDVDLWTRLAVRARFAVHPAATAIYVQQTGGAMDSQRAAAAIAIADQPVFATIARLLANPRHRAHHYAIADFRRALLLDYLRPSLFNGQVALARDYLSNLRLDGSRAPWLYRVLAHLPGPVVARGSRYAGRLRRALRR